MLAEESLFIQILNDYHCSSNKYPYNEKEFNRELQHLKSCTSKSIYDRINAYKNGVQKDYLSKPAKIIICHNCGIHRFCIEYPNENPNCDKCDVDSLVLINIKVGDIPPWIDVDTFVWICAGDGSPFPRKF